MGQRLKTLDLKTESSDQTHETDAWNLRSETRHPESLSSDVMSQLSALRSQVTDLSFQVSGRRSQVSELRSHLSRLISEALSLRS